MVLPAGPFRLGAQVPSEELARGVKVEVNGQVVGAALLTGQAPELSPQEQQYQARTDRSSLYAAVAATVVALALGVLLARSLTRPVRELTSATQAARSDWLPRRRAAGWQMTPTGRHSQDGEERTGRQRPEVGDRHLSARGRRV